jgi:chromosomal replication initiator protein
MIQELVPPNVSYMLYAGLRDKPNLQRDSQEALANSIFTVVCAYYGQTKTQVLSKDRYRRVCMPRQVTMYFLKRFTKMTLKEIAFFMGGRDHTTTIHSIKAIKGWIQTEPTLQKQISDIEVLIS